MSVNLNPNISFTSLIISDGVARKAKEQAIAENNTLLLNTLDKAEKVSDDNKQTPKEPGRFKRGIASIAKFFTATEEITKGTAKGAVYGTMTGVGVMFAGWLFDALPKGLKKGGSLKQTFKHPIKSVGTPAKIMAGIAAAGVAVYHIVRGKLQANQRNAFVDQKLNIKH